MENYVMVKIDELNELCEQFKKEFGVDLNDKKYSDIPELESRWNAVIQDAFGRIEEKTWKEVLEEILYYRDCVYGPVFMEAGKEDCVKERELIRKQNQKKLLELCEECKKLLCRYLLYEPDVWINAFFSIKYYELLEKKKLKEKELEKTDKKEKNPFYNKNEADMDGYCFPFTYYEKDEFCQGCRKILYDRNNQNIFGTQYNIERVFEADVNVDDKKITRKKGRAEFSGNFINNQWKIKVYYPYDINFTRWSYDRMLALEKQMSGKQVFGRQVLDMQLEDKILFYFVLNTVYVRNVLGFSKRNICVKELEEYRQLLYKSNQLKSFGWQNFICILYMGIYGEYYHVFNNDDVAILNGWEEVFEKWWKNYETINKTLKLLTGALIYIRKPGDDVIIKEKCGFYLEELEFDNRVLEAQIDFEMERWRLQDDNANKEMKLRTSYINQGCVWEYAFLQMETIHAKTYYNVQKEDGNK